MCVEVFQLFRAFTIDPKADVFYFGKESGLVVLVAKLKLANRLVSKAAVIVSFFIFLAPGWLDRSEGYPWINDRLITKFIYANLQMFLASPLSNLSICRASQ